jgi:hypothetical protein
MAGTGVGNYLHTMRALYDYLNYFRENVVTQAEIDLQYADRTKSLGRYYYLPKGKIPPLIYAEFQKFKPGTIGIEARIAATLWNVFALVGYAVLFFLVAFYAFIKMETI